MGLQVTDRATVVLKELLNRVEHQPGQIFRLAMDNDGSIRLNLDRERDGDQVVSHLGAVTLVVAPNTQEALAGVTLDAVESPTDEGAAISFHLIGRNGHGDVNDESIWRQQKD